jgi:hypothetical protein
LKDDDPTVFASNSVSGINAKGLSPRSSLVTDKGENDDAASVFQLGKNIGIGSVGGQNEKTFDIVG